MKTLVLSFVLLLLQRSLIATEIPLNFDWKTTKFASSRSSDSIAAHDQTLIYRVKPTTVRRRSRSISDAVIETVRCEHIELMDCRRVRHGRNELPDHGHRNALLHLQRAVEVVEDAQEAVEFVVIFVAHPPCYLMISFAHGLV
ncbi:hypothetical protein M3Y99_00859700 [Aphelenchoides fujianensis]|nr:hypothetical protein M3Y99_00859700 [Aphelenchoides fujianensis]